MPRNKLFAKLINKINRFWWWLTNPKTQGVKVFLINKNKILLVRLTYYPNTWTYPGGGVDKGEDLKSTASRECIEEVGIKPEKLKYIGSLDFDHEYKKDTVHIFISNLSEKVTPLIDGKEIAEARWFSLDDLPNIGRNAKKMLDLYLTKTV
ncbi:MAG: NUDIX domain-containing protein [Candidatus Paceibacterota bacterium]